MVYSFLSANRILIRVCKFCRNFIYNDNFTPPFSPNMLKISLWEGHVGQFKFSGLIGFVDFVTCFFRSGVCHAIFSISLLLQFYFLGLFGKWIPFLFSFYFKKDNRVFVCSIGIIGPRHSISRKIVSPLYFLFTLINSCGK